jgi:hypothetical protein
MIMINSKKEIPSVEAEKEQVNLTDPKRKKEKENTVVSFQSLQKIQGLSHQLLDCVGQGRK